MKFLEFKERVFTYGLTYIKSFENCHKINREKQNLDIRTSLTLY